MEQSPDGLLTVLKPGGLDEVLRGTGDAALANAISDLHVPQLATSGNYGDGLAGAGAGAGSIYGLHVGLAPLPGPSGASFVAGLGPAVRLIDARVDGPIERATAVRVGQLHRYELRYCYELEHGTTKGEVEVELDVDGSGAVAHAKLSASTFASDAMERCIVSRHVRFQFPGANSGSRVGLRWGFTP